MLYFFRKRQLAPKGGLSMNFNLTLIQARSEAVETAMPMGDRSRPDALTADRVEDLVAEYLRKQNGLEILVESQLGTAVREFVEKEEKDSIER
jgi:hypothetical protein